MPNTLGTTNSTLIARRALETLLETYPLLRLVSTDFSNEPCLYGAAINTSLPSALTAGSYSTTDGYVAQDVTQTDVAVTINQHPHATYAFNDQERSSTNLDLIERFARNAAHSIGKHMMDSLMALILNANFSNKTQKVVTDLDGDVLADLSVKLDGRNLPTAGRFACFNASAYGNLLKDTVLVANPGSPSNAIRSGQLGPVHGINVIEYPSLPNNSENLYGFAGTPEGLVIATRLPKAPDHADIPGNIEDVVEPNTGLAIQVRSWYDMQKGKEFRTFTCMYGVAKGNAACIERFVTA